MDFCEVNVIQKKFQNFILVSMKEWTFQNSDNSLIVPDHIIKFQNKSKKIIEKIESLTTLKKLNISKDNISNIQVNKKKKFYKKKYYKKNN